MESLISGAKSVEDTVKVSIHDAANKLLQFTNDYSTDVQLKKRALKLNWDILDGDKKHDQSNFSAIENEINSILGSILAKHQSNPYQVASYREDFERTRKFIIEKSFKKDLVFLGRGLSYQYGQGDFTLQPYDIELRLGEITSVVGENSSGKSTLIKVVAGEHLAKSGEISYPLFSDKKGLDIDWREIKRNIAYIPQQLDPWSGNVKDYLSFTLSIKGIRGKENIDEVEYIIHRLGLNEFVDRSWNELSGGARMRVELAKALVWKPKLLILDEPLANLDIKAQAIFLRDLKQLASSHKNPVSVLITSQHLYEMENIAHKTIFLKKNISGEHSIGEVIYNDFTANIGKERTCNSFEVDCKQQFDEIRTALLKAGITEIISHGQYYIIKAPLNINTQKMLEIMVHSNLKVTYFRDISASTRTFFEDL